MSGPIDTAVVFLGKSEGREKLFKLVSNLSKVAFSYTGDKKYMAFAKACSQGRSILRLAWYFEQLVAIRDILLAAGKKGGFDRVMLLSILRNIFEIGFIVLDNMIVFTRWMLLNPKDKGAAWGRASSLSLFIAYCMSLCIDITRLCQLDSKKVGGAGEYHALWRKYLIDVARHGCDAVASLQNSQLVPSLNLSVGTLGVMQAFSAYIAVSTQWDAARGKKAK